MFISRLFGRLFAGAAPAAARNRELAADTAAAPEAEPPPPQFLHREPILDRQQHITGYEFSLQRPDIPVGREWQASTQRFFDKALVSQLRGIDMAPLLGRKLGFVPLLAESLALPQIPELPLEKLGLSLHFPEAAASMPATDMLPPQLPTLRARGLRLAFPAPVAVRLPEAARSLVDFVTLRADRLTPADLLAGVRRVRGDYPRAGLLALGVDSVESFDACRTLQFDHFQGHFITELRVEQAPVLSSQRLVVSELIAHLKRRDADFDKLAMIARQDIALTIRLLRYINSAAMGLRRKIASLEQAMTYIGYDGLYRWLTLLLFYNSRSEQVDEALRETALARARFCEQLARRRLSRADCEQAFVTGLLSMVDVLFHMPMEQAVGHLGLPEDLRQALLEQKGKYGAYLGLALACERGDGERIPVLAAQHGLSPEEVNAMHVEALTWAVEYGVNLEGPA